MTQQGYENQQDPGVETGAAQVPQDASERAGNAAPEPEKPRIVGYCRSCGQALTEDTRRIVSGTLYCPLHAAGMASPEIAAQPSGPPPPSQSIEGSPGLAFLLGLIPGVGAIYNEQYAKGVIHVLILGALISLADGGSMGPLAGLLIALFFFYMPFEAYHTARRRQLGQPVDELSGLIVGKGRGAASPAGPVLLIVLGTLFLADTLNLLDFRQLLRFWPLLLIGVGVYRLLVAVKSPGRAEVRHE